MVKVVYPKLLKDIIVLNNPILQKILNKTTGKGFTYIK